MFHHRITLPELKKEWVFARLARQRRDRWSRIDFRQLFGLLWYDATIPSTSVNLDAQLNREEAGWSDMEVSQSPRPGNVRRVFVRSFNLFAGDAGATEVREC